MSALARRPPRGPVRPKKIGRINPVTIFLLLLLAAAIYAGWKLVPPWFGQFRVREVMGEVAVTAGRDPDLDALDELLRARLAEIGITPAGEPVWRVSDAEIVVKLRYDAVVVHPFLLAPTLLRFEPEVSSPRGAGVL